MGDAAKAARGAFSEIKTGSREMGAELGGHMGHARHGVMLLGEEFGVHLPRGITTFIASLGPVGAAMSAAFPFLAIAVGATLLLEHLAKVKEAGEKLTADQVSFAVACQNAFNQLDEKLLQAGIRADELSGNHFGALIKQLKLIDRQSMEHLSKTFDELSVKAVTLFGELKSHWYTFGVGSDYAKRQLTEFKGTYDTLLSQGKDKEASDLLAGTRKSMSHILAMMQQANTGQAQPGEPSTHGREQAEAVNELRKAGVGQSEKEIAAQRILVEQLNTQVGIESRIAELKKAQESNAAHATQNKISGEADKADKANAEEERKELEFQEKQRSEAQRRAVAALQEGEREKIDATEHGSAARLAAIAAAIREEENWGLQETGFYRSLLVSRVQTARQMTDEQNKLAAEAGKQQAEHTRNMGELALAAEREHAQLLMSAHRQTAAQIIAQKLQEEAQDYRIKMAAFAQEIAALDKHGKDYDNKLAQLKNKEAELTRKHENDITAIKDKAALDRNRRILAGEAHMQDEIARGLSSVLMRHQSFGAMMDSIGAKVAEGMMTNAIKSVIALDFTKEKEAASAARKAFDKGMDFPFPTNFVLAPAMGAMAFASVMAFAGGTDRVPGIGSGDVVPAMLTPGEGVVPGGVMDGLSRMARSGGFDGGGTHYHAHVSPTYHLESLDSAGIERVLSKHSNTLTKHVENTLRKMNR
jgi:hypothetical protein